MTNYALNENVPISTFSALISFLKRFKYIVSFRHFKSFGFMERGPYLIVLSDRLVELGIKHATTGL